MSLIFRRSLRAASIVFYRNQTISLQTRIKLIYCPLTHFLHLERTPFHRRVATSAEPKMKDLAIPEVLEEGKKGTAIIDVREQVEIHNTGLIPGSINIPLGHLDEALNLSDADFKERYSIEKPGKDDKIIMSCQSGNRSKKAVMALQEKGFTNLYNNAGGWKSYEEFTKGK